MSDTTSYLYTGTTLTLFHEGGVHTCSSSHHHWDSVIKCLKDEEWDEIVELLRPVEALRSYAADSGITITDYNILYKGENITGALADRILQMKAEGFNIDPMVKFLENLQQNPSYRSREQLYGFLENNNLPITSDGCFMAYKRVNSDFKDMHSGQFDNTPGQVVEMPRSRVDDDPNRTCAAGLHVCSREYLAHFHGTKLVACKVNPADVVAVPTDYNFTKMRVARYEVTEELPLSLATREDNHWHGAVYDTAIEDDYDDGYNDD